MSISYRDSLNQSKKDHEYNDHIDSKLKNIGNLFNNTNNNFVLNIYNRLCDNYKSIKEEDNIDLIIFLIFIFVKNNVNIEELDKIYLKNEEKIKEIFNIDSQYLPIIFFTYANKLNDLGIKDIIKNINFL